MALRPAQLTSQRFTRRLLGVDRREVAAFLADIAAAVERMQAELARIDLERRTCQTALEAVKGDVETWKTQVSDLHAQLAAYRERETMIVRAFTAAQQACEEAAARARTEAGELLASANAEAQRVLGASRLEAAELLQATRKLARETRLSGERAAAAELAVARADARHLVDEAHAVASEIHVIARHQIDRLCAKIGALLRERDMAQPEADRTAAPNPRAGRPAGNDPPFERRDPAAPHDQDRPSP